MGDNAGHETTELTGNHYLSFPRIERRDASIASVSALHAGMGGVVAWEGDPLMCLSFARSGASVPLSSVRWQRLERWIPHAECDWDQDARIEITICAPGGYEPLARGGFIACTVHNRGRSDLELDAVLDVRVARTTIHIATPRPLHTSIRATAGAMQRGVAFEMGVPAPIAALGVVAEDAAASYDVVHSDGQIAPFPLDDEVTAVDGTQLHARISMRMRVRPGRSAQRSFYIGIGRDRDSALGHAAHLLRVGTGTLLQEARLELAHLTRRPADVKLSELINRNLLFNHYFGLARAFDDDRLYALSSRSPDHVPGAALNEREMLFWTLPCITLSDPLLARELLRDAFEVYSAQPGLQWRYLDGGVIEPGFSLEHALMYPLAVDRYVRETGDDGILDDPLIQDVLREIDGGLDSRLHPDILLCESDVLPGGEAADHPYPTLGNVMLWAYAEALPRIWRSDDGEAPASFEEAGEEISDAIWQRCMAGIAGSQMFVSSTDLEKSSAVYDDPLFSLGLLPFFGFCAPSDPTMRDTMALLRSQSYPFWRDGVAPGLASRAHPEHPSLAALCTDLLGERKDAALRTIRALQLTDGIASDRYDSVTGQSAGTRHAAALAGLLAWTLVLAIDGPAKKPAEKDRKKK
jgi:hypothetical protein